MLRIDDLGFLRAIAEKRGIELVNIIKHRGRFYEIGVRGNLRRYAQFSQVLFCETPNGFNPLPEILPKPIDIISSREAASHAYHSDAFMDRSLCIFSLI